MGRKKNTAVPVNSSPAQEKSCEAFQARVGQVDGTEKEKSNGTVTSPGYADTPVTEPQALILTPQTAMSKTIGGSEGADAANQWKIFTSQSWISDKGMALRFLAPVILEGTPTARLEQTEVEKMNEIWAYSLIVYIVGQNPTLTALKTYIMTQWHLIAV